MASPNLPLHICKEAQADQVYDKHAGTKLLGVSIPLVFSKEALVNNVQPGVDLFLANKTWSLEFCHSNTLGSRSCLPRTSYLHF